MRLYVESGLLAAARHEQPVALVMAMISLEAGTETAMEKKSVRIVIADDEGINRLALTYTLASYPEFRLVGQAETGVEAVRMACDCAPDIVLMDVTMPEMSGIQATAEIKLQNPGVKILMLSASVGKTELAEAISVGADGYCLKESSREKLKFAIDTIISLGTYIDPYFG